MSSTTRAQRGNNKGVQQNNPNTKHNKNTDKHSGDTPKNQDKIQAKPTAEQMRIAQITDVHMENPGIREMVTTIIEMTCRSEEEVCSALHDCDNDMDRAVNMLYENNTQSGWETSVKKKKSRVGSTGGGTGGEGEEWDASAGNGGHIEQPRVRSRGGSGGPRGARRGNLDSRGWRGREQRENERNLDEGSYRGDGGYRRGGGRSLNGPGGRGGGYGGRGGRGGGRLGGPRNYQSRGEFQSRGPRHTETSESWDEPQANTYNNHNQTDNWGEKFPSPEDWDNEEYTGSLADTKVFTPSGNIEPIQGNVSITEQSVQDTSMQEQNDIIQQYSATVVSSSNLPSSDTGRSDQSLSPPQLHPDTTSNIPGFTSPKNPAVITPSSNMSISVQGSIQNTSGIATLPLSQPPPLPEVHSAPTAAQQLTQALEVHSSVAGTQSSSSLSAEQSQYFSTLSQQNNDLKNSAYGSHPAGQPVSAGSPYSNSVSSTYNTQVYGNGSNYVVTGREPVVSAAPQPQRKQRARVPPPSKIPASAVEMPGDVSSSIGFLDVQFGALEFGSDTSSFDGNATESKYEAPSTPQPPIDVVQPLETYKSSTTINTSLGQSQMLSNTDTLSQPSNEHSLNSVSVQNYSSQSRSGSAAPPVVVSVTNTPSTTNATLEQLTKSDSHTGYGSASASTVSQYQQNSYSKSQSAYQTPAPYSNNYSNTQVTTSYPQQSTVNSYSNSSGYNSGNVSAVYQPNNSNYSSPSVQSVSGYPTHSQGFSSITQPAAFPTQSQGAYQTTNANQSVYGAGTGLNTNYAGSNSANSVSGSQYNNYTASVATTHSHKLPNKDQQYDSPVSTTVSLSTTATSVNSSALVLTTQPSATVTKTTNSSVGTNKNAVSTTGTANSGGMAGVAPVMGQYIMGQPYYQHPLYSYEELQLLQQRIPHMTTGYYDMGYQTTPTTLGTGRDAALGSVAYSMSDGRFARADNNASPVPSTMSQQTGSGAGHAGAPMLNHTLPPGYAYFYGGGAMMPGSFQYGTPAIYPQMPTTANAHGSTNTSQYPKPSYSGYGSGYDSLSQSQDYSKPGGYPGAVSGGVGSAQGGPQTGNKGVTGATTQGAGPGGANTDLSSAMYGKSHAALNKVNSYEKQGFHSGTPPPFNLTGTSNSGLAPSGTYGAPHLFIQAMPQHQHHNTQLLHQPLHQDSGNSSGQRSQASSQPKTGTKQGYSPSTYWTPN